MTYRSINPTETAPNAPVTSTLMVALAENLEAVALGEVNATKLALKSEIGSVTGGNIDFNGIGAWSGVWFKLEADNPSGISSATVSLDATVDGGSNYLGSQTLVSIPQSTDSASLTGFFDFATGLVHGVINRDNDVIQTFSQTIAGASLAINGIRFIAGGNITAAVLIHPNGGESAT